MGYINKRRSFLLVGLLLICFCESPAQAPTWNEWFRQKKTQRRYLVKQIIALQVYMNSLKKGYQIANSGLKDIGSIRRKSLGLDTAYFNAHKRVSPVIAHSGDINECMALQHKILAELRRVQLIENQDGSFSNDEHAIIDRVCDGILSSCNETLGDIQTVVTAGHVEMTDDERLTRLSDACSEMKSHFEFTMAFSQNVSSISAQRSLERKEDATVRSLVKTDL